MSGFSPRWLIAPTTVALVAAALLVSPETGTIGSDAAYSDPESDAASQELDKQQSAVRARIAYKDVLIDRLISGEFTLAEVSAEFLSLNRGTQAQSIIRDIYPGSGDEEKSARNVIDFVRLRKLPAEQNAAVMARLWRQFEQVHGQPGAVGG
ncbi:MAG TPA: hypothetical protein VM533_01735 [Fimbriiglobus sp.]|jgi:hypothetical protein|nr:hypothetical protein [Fimbriiglobus sp.]